MNPNARNVFEVPSDHPNLTTLYKCVKQERIGIPSTPFSRRYHGEFYPQARTRYSKHFLEKRQAYLSRGEILTPKEVLEVDNGLFVTNKFDSSS